MVVDVGPGEAEVANADAFAMSRSLSFPLPDENPRKNPCISLAVFEFALESDPDFSRSLSLFFPAALYRAPGKFTLAGWNDARGL
jgi:hypothetical protein